MADSWSRCERVLVMAGTRILTRTDAKPGEGQPSRVAAWLSTEEAERLAGPGAIRILLGEHEDDLRFLLLAPSAVSREDLDRERWLTSRELFWTAGPGSADTAWLLHAVGLAEWHAATRFCPRCGARVASKAAGHELVCPDCGRSQFPRSDPAVIMLITDGEPGDDEERCLLGRQAIWPERRFSTLAGFCEPGETLEDAVRREVAEETGVAVGHVTYAGNQPWPFPASLMLGFYGRAEDPSIEVDEREIAEARWFTRTELHDLANAGAIRLPDAVSISRSLIETWYGGELPGTW